MKPNTKPDESTLPVKVDAAIPGKAEGAGKKPEKGSRGRGRGRGGRGSFKPTKSNDASWYARNPQLVVDTCNLPFNWKNGLALNGPTEFNGNWQVRDKFAIPSVICYNYHMLFGVSKQKNSLNTIANNLYSYIRYANSGSRNYESPDLFMYCCAISGPFALAAFIAKCIGLANVASPINRAYPRQVFEAMKIDYADVMANIASYRGYLNSLIVRLNAYNVPAKFYCYSAHSWMANAIYIESDNPKDVIYTTRPRTMLIWSGTTVSTGSSLNVKHLWNYSGQYTTLKFLLDILRDAILALETDEDIGIISGDILKAIGGAECFKMGMVPEEYSVVPEYNETMLWKLKNCRMLPIVLNNGSHPVELLGVDPTDFTKFKPCAQDNDGEVPLYYQVAPGGDNIQANQVETCVGIGDLSSEVANSATLYYTAHHQGILDTKSLTPSTDEINEDIALRYTVAESSRTLVNYTTYEIDNAGLILISDATVISYAQATEVFTEYASLSNEFLVTMSNTVDVLGVVLRLAPFKYVHLNFQMIQAFSLNPTILYEPAYFGDFTNVHVLTREEVANILDSQLLSEFAVPATEHLGKAASFAK